MNYKKLKLSIAACLLPGMVGLLPSPASAEKLPPFKTNPEDFFYSQQTSLWIFIEIPRATILNQVGDTLARLGFELVSFDHPDTGIVLLKPMVFSGEFGSQTAEAPGVAPSTEIELTVLVRPKNKAALPGSFDAFLLGKHPDKSIGQLRLDVLCDNEVAVSAGRKNFGEHKFLGSFEYTYPVPNSSVGAAPPFSLDMTAYTWQGAGKTVRKMFRIQADLSALKPVRAELSPELLFAAFPPEPAAGESQRAIGEFRHYGRALQAFRVPSGKNTLTLSYGEAQGAELLKPVAPFGDGKPIAGSDEWPSEMRERIDAFVSAGKVAGYLLYRSPSAEYEPKPFNVF